MVADYTVEGDSFRAQKTAPVVDGNQPVTGVHRFAELRHDRSSGSPVEVLRIVPQPSGFFLLES